jgi:thiosulfate/3-mercaptopyruvate sulfurtransferase
MALGKERAAQMSDKGEIVVYCSTGGKASAWHFVLSRILGFKDVRIYDGSVQEWSSHHELEVENVRIMLED